MMDSFVECAGWEMRVQGKLLRTARLELDKYVFLDNPRRVIEELRKCKERVDLFTFMEALPDDLVSSHQPKYDYPMEWDNLAVLPVSTFDNWWNHQIKSVPRNRARQAEKKGVVVKEVPFDATLVQGIWEVYNECPIRQGVRFKHYGRDLEWVRGHAGTFLDRSIFIGAYLGDRMIGFIKLVTDEARRQACTMHILSTIEHREKAPTNAMVAQAVRSCADRGIPYLVYQNFSYGKKQGDSLSHFKEINGFQRVDLPRYYVPLTALGSAAFKLGLHRRLADHLPQSVGAKLRELRKNWYAWKFRSAAEA